MIDISVVIPVYNVEKYIEYCITSILKQKEINFEIIIIDDGSTDQSFKVCNKYARTLKNIQLVHIENRGISFARNLGVKYSKGKYIHFVDSDDFLLHDNIYQQLFSEVAEYDADIILGRSRFFDENINFIGENSSFGFSGPAIGNVFEIILNIGAMFVNSSPCNKIIKRDFIIKNNLLFKNGIYHEDDLWIAECFSKKPYVFFYDKAIYGVRRRPKSIMTTDNSELIYQKALSKIYISDKLCELMKSTDISKDAKGVYIQNYISFFIEGVKASVRVRKEDRKSLVSAIKKNKNVLENAKYTKSFNLKILYIMSKIFPSRFWINAILKRYNVSGSKQNNEKKV